MSKWTEAFWLVTLTSGFFCLGYFEPIYDCVSCSITQNISRASMYGAFGCLISTVMGGKERKK